MSLALAGALAVVGAIIVLPAQSSSPSGAFELAVAPGGDDGSCARSGGACATFDRAYQLAEIGDTVEIQAGTYSGQTIQSRADLRDLPTPCTPLDTSSCITFVPSGQVTIDGKLEVRGSSVYVKGTRSTTTPDAGATFSIVVRGYADVEANSVADHPDHVILEGIDTLAFGAFGVDTAWFRSMDVGPQTVTSTGGGCYSIEGDGFENKVGYDDGVLYAPRNVTIDSVRIHDQNGDKNRELGFGGSGCHFGGLFLVAVNGLTVQGSVFERNVVYHVIIQGDPAKLTGITFDSNSFGCPVEWTYRGDVCDGQRAIQFSGAYPTVELTNNVSANGTFWPNDASGLYGCYTGDCGSFADNPISGNVDLPRAVVAPALPASATSPTPGPTPTPPSTPGPPSSPAPPSTPTHPSTPPPPSPPAPAPAAPACDNGNDDDGDGKIDFADPGCTSHSDTDETDAPAASPASGASPTAPQPVDIPSSANLQRGDAGVEVEALQAALDKLGYTPGTLDGTFGALTERAVVAFQRTEGLTPDGIAGPKTVAALNTALAHA